MEATIGLGQLFGHGTHIDQAHRAGERQAGVAQRLRRCAREQTPHRRHDTHGIPMRVTRGARSDCSRRAR